MQFTQFEVPSGQFEHGQASPVQDLPLQNENEFENPAAIVPTTTIPRDKYDLISFLALVVKVLQESKYMQIRPVSVETKPSETLYCLYGSVQSLTQILGVYFDTPNLIYSVVHDEYGKLVSSSIVFKVEPKSYSLMAVMKFQDIGEISHPTKTATSLFSGMQLDYTRTLADYNIKKQATILFSAFEPYIPSDLQCCILTYYQYILTSLFTYQLIVKRGSKSENGYHLALYVVQILCSNLFLSIGNQIHGIVF
ncbi:Hypothetical_protein [Hexamita inflata]|uniref:Hypothetical_protein n=1 Tax=Hexamita inflata TaxID=28002 RepID=A0AA86TTZ7_9EUKA|nr:Hypothetical protein HINF_LOCUS16306 [Hexamita inflata]